MALGCREGGIQWGKRESQEHSMFRKLAHHIDDIALAVVVWMCTLPLVAVFVLPFFGLRVGLLVSAGLLIIILAICWRICSWKHYNS